jgi:hypothetical protein
VALKAARAIGNQTCFMHFISGLQRIDGSVISRLMTCRILWIALTPPIGANPGMDELGESNC